MHQLGPSLLGSAWASEQAVEFSCPSIIGPVTVAGAFMRRMCHQQAKTHPSRRSLALWQIRKTLAVAVSLLCLVSVLPYIALQLKGIVAGVSNLLQRQCCSER